VTTKKVAKKAAAKAAKKSARRAGRPTLTDQFLQTLKELSGDQQTLVSNRAVKESLGWDEDRYRRVKEQLRSENLIILGRGQGGTVGLSVASKADALKVFVSYSHADEQIKDSLIKHIKPLERMSLIASWNDRQLLAGTEWDGEINRQLEEADLVLLLVSIDFINSKYCYDVELEKALERHAEGKCKVVPIIVRGCLWRFTPFAKLQALPRDGKPIVSHLDQDEAMANIAEGIRLVAEEVIASR
jgi:hypothetical protein